MITDLMLEPTEGSFDVESISKHLVATPHTIREPAQPNKYMLFGDADSAQRAVDERSLDPVRYPYSAILVTVAPRMVGVYCRTSSTEPARSFVKWLKDKYKMKYEDDQRNDLTAFIDPELIYLYGGPED